MFTQFDDLRLPAFTVMDLGIWYRWKLSDTRTLRLVVNLDNVLNKESTNARAAVRSSIRAPLETRLAR
jgi:hypothetical protein